MSQHLELVLDANSAGCTISGREPGNHSSPAIARCAHRAHALSRDICCADFLQMKWYVLFVRYNQEKRVPEHQAFLESSDAMTTVLNSLE